MYSKLSLILTKTTILYLKASLTLLPAKFIILNDIDTIRKQELNISSNIKTFSV